MKNTRLQLYHMDMKYIRKLAQKDENVMSISPQLHKESRPFVGIVVICRDRKYCIPLTSPKPKHDTMKNGKDFSKIYDKKGKLLGVVNFNNMIPVNDNVITRIDVSIYGSDSPKDKAYKELLRDQLDWCNENKEAIVAKANKLYVQVTEHPEKSFLLTKRCCKFKELEALLEKYQSK